MNHAGKRIFLATAAFTAAFFSVSSSAETVEVYLLDRLDGDLNDYCHRRKRTATPPGTGGADPNSHLLQL